MNRVRVNPFISSSTRDEPHLLHEVQEVARDSLGRAFIAMIRTLCFLPCGGVALDKPHQENESDLHFERITVACLQVLWSIAMNINNEELYSQVDQVRIMCLLNVFLFSCRFCRRRVRCTL